MEQDFHALLKFKYYLMIYVRNLLMSIHYKIHDHGMETQACYADGFSHLA